MGVHLGRRQARSACRGVCLSCISYCAYQCCDADGGAVSWPMQLTQLDSAGQATSLRADASSFQTAHSATQNASLQEMHAPGQRPGPLTLPGVLLVHIYSAHHLWLSCESWVPTFLQLQLRCWLPHFHFSPLALMPTQVNTKRAMSLAVLSAHTPRLVRCMQQVTLGFDPQNRF